MAELHADLRLLANCFGVDDRFFGDEPHKLEQAATDAWVREFVEEWVTTRL